MLNRLYTPPNKTFNTEGVCVPRLHYMVDTSAMIEQIAREFVEPGKYFVINRARQFGKTTTLQALRNRLKDDYLVVLLSFEGREGYFDSAESLVDGICGQIYDKISIEDTDLASMIMQKTNKTPPMVDLSQRITELCKQSQRKIVVLIDEVDRATDYKIFASFLGMLREKYLTRYDIDGISTFHSVILAGVHDIKNLKAKIRPDSEHAYNSPWNIAAQFDVDMSFSASAIETMLASYEADHHTGMDIRTIANRLYYHTNGYPFLVSALCKMIHETHLQWTSDGVDDAAAAMLTKTNTLFDDMIKNIENNTSFGDMVESLLIGGQEIPFVPSDRDVSLGMMYGIFRRDGGRIVISNRIFELYIYEHMLMRVRRRNRIPTAGNDKSPYIKNGKLLMDVVIERFAEFMYSEFRKEDESFIEREGRLLFLAYLRPLLNGMGRYYVEPQTRGSRRMDIAVEFNNEDFIIELKIWHGEAHEQDAYDQLAEYVKLQHLTKGYLVSYCDLKKSPRKGRRLVNDGVDIHEVVVAYKDDALQVRG